MSDPLLIALADAYFDDELDATGAASLDAALASNASFRHWFADQCRREVALRAVLVREEQARHTVSGPYPVLGPGTATMHRHSDSSSRWRRSGRARPRRRPLARSPQATAPLLAAAVLAAIGIVVWMLHRPAVSIDRSVAVIMAVSAPDYAWQIGERLVPGQPVVAAAGLTLRFPVASAQVELAAGTQGEIRSDGMHLLNGAVQVALPPQRAQNPFRIITPQAQVEVIGTDFAVTVHQQQTTLAVRSGTVAWTTAQGRRLVRAGETVQWPLPEVPEPAVEPVATTPAPLATEPERAITALILCHAVTGAPVTTLQPDTQLSWRHVGTDFMAIRAEVTEAVRSVVFTVDGPTQGNQRSPMEAIPPFIYPGDTDGVIEADWRLQVGTYRVTAQAYADVHGRKRLGSPVVVTFTVVADE